MDINHSFFGSRIAVAVTALALAAGIPALAQQSTTPSDSTQATQSAPSKAEKKAARKERKEKMAKELGLTADQKKQLKALKKDQHQQMKAVKHDSSLTQEQKAAKLKEIRESGMQKSDALLTPEQREKMKQLRAEHEAQEAKEGGHHWRHKKLQTTPAATTETPKS